MDSENFPHINIDPQEVNLSISDGFGPIRALTNALRHKINPVKKRTPYHKGDGAIKKNNCYMNTHEAFRQPDLDFPYTIGEKSGEGGYESEAVRELLAPPSLVRFFYFLI